MATDSAGKVFVSGELSANVLRITPGGAVTEIIDGSGDGPGNSLDQASAVATDSAGNVYVAGRLSDNVFRITPGGFIEQILGASGDGLGNDLENSVSVAASNGDEIFVAGQDTRTRSAAIHSTLTTTHWLPDGW